MNPQEQNSNPTEAVDRVVGDLQKDFKIVGAHRVHSWYAWAIVGIVFGMALGIVYIANRSGEVQDTDAAGRVVTMHGQYFKNSYPRLDEVIQQAMAGQDFSEVIVSKSAVKSVTGGKKILTFSQIASLPIVQLDQKAALVSKLSNFLSSTRTPLELEFVGAKNQSLLIYSKPQAPQFDAFTTAIAADKGECNCIDPSAQKFQVVCSSKSDAGKTEKVYLKTAATEADDLGSGGLVFVDFVDAASTASVYGATGAEGKNGQACTLRQDSTCTAKCPVPDIDAAAKELLDIANEEKDDNQTCAAVALGSVTEGSLMCQPVKSVN